MLITAGSYTLPKTIQNMQQGRPDETRCADALMEYKA